MAKKKPLKKQKKAAKIDAAEDSQPRAEPIAQPGGNGNGVLLNAGRVALLLATGIAVYLLVVVLSQGQAAGCEEGKSCSEVLSSKWAKLFGVPISAFGAVMYLAMIGLSFARGIGAAGTFLAVSIIGGALWFTGIQAFVLKTFCPWCCTTHALAVLGTVLILFGVPRKKAGTSGRGPNLFATAAAVGALVLTAIAQIKAPEPRQVTVSVATETAAVTVEPEIERRETVAVHDKFQLSTIELPSLGDAETAKHVAVGIFDFSCVHCRALIKVIKPVVKEYGDELAILKLPGHYNENGREIQKLMLPVFREAPDVYEELGDELYNEKVPALVATVRQELERRLGAERFQEILTAYGAWAQQRVDETKAILEANRAITKSGKLPQLMVGKTIESGNKTSAGHYHQLFADNFGLVRENAPKLVCSPVAFDLGQVVAFSEHKISLTLSNRGSVPVRIDGIKRPQGIVIPPVPKELAPGASHTVDIKMTIPSQKTAAKASAAFEVHSDAADPVITIPFTAEVLNITFDPPTLNFGAVEAGGGPKELEATLTLGAPAKLGAISCPIRFFTPGPAETLQENKVYRIKVKAEFEAGLTGARNSYVNVALIPVDGSVPWPKEIRVPVKARIIAQKKP